MSLITACNTTCPLVGLCCNEQFETTLISGPPIISVGGSGGHLTTVRHSKYLCTASIYAPSDYWPLLQYWEPPLSMFYPIYLQALRLRHFFSWSKHCRSLRLDFICILIYTISATTTYYAKFFQSMQDRKLRFSLIVRIIGHSLYLFSSCPHVVHMCSHISSSALAKHWFLFVRIKMCQWWVTDDRIK